MSVVISPLKQEQYMNGSTPSPSPVTERIPRRQRTSLAERLLSLVDPYAGRSVSSNVPRWKTSSLRLSRRLWRSSIEMIIRVPLELRLGFMTRCDYCDFFPLSPLFFWHSYYIYPSPLVSCSYWTMDYFFISLFIVECLPFHPKMLSKINTGPHLHTCNNRIHNIR